MADRYCFNMRKGYVWWEMITNKYHFWRTWGIWKTLKYLFKDTFTKPKMHGWTPVNKMPKSPTAYLCIDMKYESSDLPEMYIATTWSKVDGFYENKTNGKRLYPTHWKQIVFPEG